MWSRLVCLLRNPSLIAVYLETYGCQMNVNDTEIAWSVLQKSGYLRTRNLQEVHAFSPSIVFWAWVRLLLCQFLFFKKILFVYS